MTINYKIEMLSDWHVGSGLDSASEADALVLKDEDKLPYIPGKTIKGLLKDAFKDMLDVDGASITKDQVDIIFGYVIEKSGENNQKPEDKIGSTKSGTAFFSNAIVNETERKEIIGNNLSEHLYRNIASTKIDDNGVAEGKSLRVMQVYIPLTLEGQISEINEKDKELFEKAFKWLRHLGVNRNRGLGRCKCSIINTTENQAL